MGRVMIVGRNRLLRETLGDIFRTQFPSIPLMVTPGGVGLIDEVDLSPPQLMLIEVKLSAENGFDLSRKIKRNYPDVTIVLVGSYDLPEYREAARISGADYFISQDSPVEEYLELIGSILFPERP